LGRAVKVRVYRGIQSVLCTDQIYHRFVARNRCRVQRVGREKISIARTQLVNLITHAQFELATQYPVGLIFGVGVRAILGSGRIAPLKDAIAFAGQPRFQLPRIRRC
jgi:hypothetical protein